MPFAVFDPLEKIEEENTIVKRLDGSISIGTWYLGCLDRGMSAKTAKWNFFSRGPRISGTIRQILFERIAQVTHETAHLSPDEISGRGPGAVSFPV
jgi:hypothetical protein